MASNEVLQARAPLRHIVRVIVMVTFVAAALIAVALIASEETPVPGASRPSQVAGPITFPKIDRSPSLRPTWRRSVSAIPKYDPASENSFQIDLRSADLSALDLRKSGGDLAYAVFDTRTVWPDAARMPEGFDPNAILQLGKNPGLGIRSLHARGITGKGVGIAVIDPTLVIDHDEIAGCLRLYEEIGMLWEMDAEMHGCATSSIAAGRTAGVAPEAALYHVATYAVDFKQENRSKENRDFHTYVLAIRRILEVNRQLPENEKIRAISLSIGWRPGETGYDEITSAANAAKEAGLLVTSCSITQTHGFAIHGLGREPMAAPDRFESYQPGIWWANSFPGHDPRIRRQWSYHPPRDQRGLMIPMDSRTMASSTGKSDYIFCRIGGWSWITPYLAGVYALACQVKPEITPDEFMLLALDTGRTIEFSRDGRSGPLGPIIDPVAIITALEKGAQGKNAPAQPDAAGK